MQQSTILLISDANSLPNPAVAAPGAKRQQHPRRQIQQFPGTAIAERQKAEQLQERLRRGHADRDAVWQIPEKRRRLKFEEEITRLQKKLAQRVKARSVVVCTMDGEDLVQLPLLQRLIRIRLEKHP